MTIKTLCRQGKSIKSITRDLGVSRNTVRKYVRTDGPAVRGRGKQRKPSVLEPFKDYLQQRIQEAKPNWIPASVLYREIQELGYLGKDRLVRHYLQQFKPAPKPDPVVRFETKPGQQMQVDFTTYKRGKTLLKAFVATLGYSRASFVYFYDNERTEAWTDGLVRAFEYFGGVPQEVLFDNAKCIMIKRDAYAQNEHRWNPALMQLVKEYGFVPRVCRPYRAKTKGKVERFNRYLKETFILPIQSKLSSKGRAFSVEMANGYIGSWLAEVANNRVHGTTKSRPNALLPEDQENFLPLPIRVGNGKKEMTLARTRVVPIPVESLQHPLSIYDQLLEMNYDFTA